GVAVDSAGNVYVADTLNNTIRKGNVAHAVIVVAGAGFDFNDSKLGLILAGLTGQLVVVEASTDLVSWLPIWTNIFTGALNFSDPQSGVYANRFYRARTP
ncbi:MAG: hypothetical protein HY674_11520, partial [Chloroflexi bacterium]|nr:hypothetical protein [Chloroflexota bacterium]